MDMLSPPSKSLSLLSEAAARSAASDRGSLTLPIFGKLDSGLVGGGWSNTAPSRLALRVQPVPVWVCPELRVAQGHRTAPVPRSASSPWLSLAACQSVSSCVYLRVALCFWLKLAVAGGCISVCLAICLCVLTTTSSLCRLTVSLHLTLGPGLCFSIFFCL